MEFLRRFHRWFRRAKLDADMTREMRTHLEFQTERNRAAGMKTDDAHYAALRQFGNVASFQEQAREQRGWVWLEQTMQDVRFAARQLRRSPGFASVVIVTLALAIGANTAIFSFFRGILLQPLPYAEPERVVLLKKGVRDFGDAIGNVALFAADFVDLQKGTRTVAQLATFTADVATLTGRGEPDLVYGAIVSHDFFPALGGRPILGRTITPADRAGSGDRPVVVSSEFWRSHLGGAPDAVGRTIILNRVALTVVGVMPDDFDFPRGVKFWAAPLGAAPENQLGAPVYDARGRGNNVRLVFGRLRAGVTPDEAEQELTALVQRLPNPNTTARSIRLVNMRDQEVGDVRPALALLLACVGLVLLIACLNVANLMLSRATTRQREMGVRLALGSGRGRIVRQLLTESVLLALLGGTAGVLLSRWGLDLLVRLAPDGIPRLSAVRVDGWVLGFALAISTFTGVLCGLAPVLETAKADLASSMKVGGRSGSAGKLPQRLRAWLVTGEVAISMVLLVAAGLLLRSFWQMQASSWGFSPVQVVSARVAFMDERYNANPARLAFYHALIEKLEAAPGFEAVGTSLDRIGESWVHIPFTPEGRVYARPEDAPQANLHLLVSPGYFRTLGIPLVQGRAFEPADGETADRVVIVDSALARHYFPGESAVGKRVSFVFFGEAVQARIVGVVGPVKSDGPAGEARPDLYVPFPQFPWNNLFVHVRTPVGVAAAGATIKRIVSEIDATAPVIELADMEQVIAKPANARRFPLGLLAVFAAVALLLAAVGIYGVTAYSVAQRTREIGVRMALGAQPGEVVALVLRQGFRPIALGLGAGLVGSAGAAFEIRHMLFEVAPLDAWTFATIPVGLLALALAACAWPARRAARVDPLVALRAE